MNAVKSYKDLLVWQKSMVLVNDIYNITELFPKSERFVLCSQMQRCAVSVPSNIAEGFLRRGRKDYLRFINVAYASGGELETQLEIARMRKYIDEDSFNQADKKIQEIMKMLNGLIVSLESKINH